MDGEKRSEAWQDECMEQTMQREREAAAKRAMERDIEREHYRRMDKEDALATTPPPGAQASDRKWHRGWPDGSGMEHILNENNEPLLTTWSMYAAGDGFKKPKRIEEDALDQAVRDHNSAAEARALLERCEAILRRSDHCNMDHRPDECPSCILYHEVRTFLAGAPPDAK